MTSVKQYYHISFVVHITGRWLCHQSQSEEGSFPGSDSCTLCRRIKVSYHFSLIWSTLSVYYYYRHTLASHWRYDVDLLFSVQHHWLTDIYLHRHPRHILVWYTACHVTCYFIVKHLSHNVSYHAAPPDYNAQHAPHFTLWIERNMISDSTTKFALCSSSKIFWTSRLKRWQELFLRVSNVHTKTRTHDINMHVFRHIHIHMDIIF